MSNEQAFNAMQSSPPLPDEMPSMFAFSRYWDLESTQEIDALTSNIALICAKVKEKFGFIVKPYQACVMDDIAYKKRNVMVLVATEERKSLTVYALPVIIRGIVLFLSLLIALIDDQVYWLAIQHNFD